MDINNFKCHFITAHQELEELVPHFMSCDAIGFDTETLGLDPFTDAVRLVQIATAEAVYVIDVWQVHSIECLRPLFEGEEVLKIGHNLKFDIKMMKVQFGFEFLRIFDTMLASQLIGNGKLDQKRKHNLYEVVKRYLNIELDKTNQLSDWSKKRLDQDQIDYAAKDVAVLKPLCLEIINYLRKDQLLEAARLEFNCCIATAQLELNGVYIEENMWEEMLNDFGNDHASLTIATKDALGNPEINLNSPIQIVKALNALGVEVDSSGEDVLAPFASKHPAVALLLDYREVQKLLSSYGTPKRKRKDGRTHFLDFVHPKTGRVHAEFHQLTAETGRFSCTNPNVQQVPGLEKAMFRWAFRGQHGRDIIVSDYSQVELRIIADFSMDLGLINAFLTGEDIHKATAALVYDLPLDQITKFMRRSVKSVNFGLAYGRGLKSLAAQMESSIDEAREVLFKWRSRLRKAWDYLQTSSRTAVRMKSCRTASGRIRYFEFDARNPGQLASAEREGKNTPIQGTSADITKLAMWMLHQRFKNESDIKMINTVHDELVFESHPSVSQDAAQVIQDIMQEAGSYYIKNVPIIAEPMIGKAWAEKDAEAHHMEIFNKRFPEYALHV